MAARPVQNAGQPYQGTTKGTVPMTTTKWNIDAAHSGINFSIRHMVVSKVRGRFATYSGAIDLDGADLTRSTLTVGIDAASIDTGTAQRDQHLRSADFF